MKGFKILFTLVLFLGILAVMFLMDIPTYMMIKRGQILDYNHPDEAAFTVKSPIEGTVDLTIGACAERNKTKSSGSTRYYVLCMQNGKFILYETGKQSEYSTLDQICKETVDWYKSWDEAEKAGDASLIRRPTATLAIEGVVKKPGSDVMKLFEEYYDEVIGDGQFQQSAETTVMISQQALNSFTGIVIAGFVCAGLFVILGIVTVILWRKL